MGEETTVPAGGVKSVGVMKGTTVDLGEQREGAVGAIGAGIPSDAAGGVVGAVAAGAVTKALAAWVLDDWQWEQALVCCPR